ncbi:MAG: glutathione S-transferase [Pseudomonadota bacterium]
MTYQLVLGDPAYSSWSLRGWLLFHRWSIPFETRWVSFSLDQSVAEQMPDMAPARTVPAVKMPDGAVVGDSLAIAEELATRHPDLAFWPQDSVDRAAARAMVAEMHSGFAVLRQLCPMNVRCAYSEVPIPSELESDLSRINVLWQEALNKSGGPWLFGQYTVADAFFAPVAARIAGYGLPVSQTAQGYVARHLADPAFLEWRKMGLEIGPDLEWYAMTYPQVAWPGP